MSETVCPVCTRPMEDTRRLLVECFYDVSEVAPSAVKVPFLREVADAAVTWFTTRRYPAGTRDMKRCVRTEEGNLRLVDHADPLPPLRVEERVGYLFMCCKSCRGDFLTMLGAWARGDLALPSEPSETANVPIRVNGAVRYVTEEDWKRRRAAGL